MQNQRNSPGHLSFSQVVDLYRAKVRLTGECPSIEELVAEYPALESEIRERMPAVILLEQTRAGKQIEDPDHTHLAGCVIQGKIGEGGMGVVYRGYQEDFDRHVALKVISYENAPKLVVERFALERQAMARLDHPNIVPAYSYIHEEATGCLIMKLIEGHSLSQLLSENCDFRGRVMLQELRTDGLVFANLMKAFASALAHAHERGMIHRDVKPSNLLIDTEGKPWVTDFGLAKLVNTDSRSLSQTGDVIGTPRYMAPEQLAGACDQRSDIYSLGVTLYEFVSGKKAWGSGWTEDSPTKNAVAEFQPICDLCPDFPQDLGKIIMKCCRFSPSERYQTAAELETILGRYLQGVRADRREGVRKSIYQRRIVRACMAAVLGTIIGGAVTTYRSWTSKPKDDANKLALVSTSSNPAPNPLSLLAENPNDLGAFISEAIRSSVDQASEDLKLETAEKVGLNEGFNELLDQLESHEMTPERLTGLVEEFDNSGLAGSTRVMGVIPVIQASRLSPQEKKNATSALRRMAVAISRRLVSSREVDEMIAAFNKHVLVTNASGQNSVNDKALRRWLGILTDRTAELNVDDLSVADEIRNLFKNHGMSARDK